MALSQPLLSLCTDNEADELQFKEEIDMKVGDWVTFRCSGTHGKIVSVTEDRADVEFVNWASLSNELTVVSVRWANLSARRMPSINVCL